ncbi:MAG: chemotaxis protein CheW [Acidobacteriota bacterium]|nr:chemotaxis protein CheW [Acidobacteriota bacterium]
MSDLSRFVVFPLGARHYAVESSRVSELLMPLQVFGFPHTTPSLEGVLVRRGTVIPVVSLPLAYGLGGPRRLYLVTCCTLGGRPETVAIPVSGECELLAGVCGEAAQPEQFITGTLHAEGRSFPLLDIDGIVAHCIQAQAAGSGEARQ